MGVWSRACVLDRYFALGWLEHYLHAISAVLVDKEYDLFVSLLLDPSRR